MALEHAAGESATALSGARSAASQTQADLDRADTAISRRRDELRQIRDPLAQFGAPPLGENSLSGDWRALADWSGGQAELRATQIAAEHQRALDADNQAMAAQAALLAKVGDRAVGLPADLTPAAAVTEAPLAITAALTAAHAAVTRAQERLDASEKLRSQLTEATEAAEVAKSLMNHLRANKFPQWLLSSALDTLLRDASKLLLELSGGQFELVRDERDLMVVDHNDADMARPVKTLSGGETFQASLALALALSDQVTSLSTAGASRLESIFLDEGFGTLDDATLDVVAGTLESLAASGSRMVGVITHVPALAERIPVRFRVHRDSAGSRIEREEL